MQSGRQRKSEGPNLSIRPLRYDFQRALCLSVIPSEAAELPRGAERASQRDPVKRSAALLRNKVQKQTHFVEEDQGVFEFEVLMVPSPRTDAGEGVHRKVRKEDYPASDTEIGKR